MRTQSTSILSTSLPVIPVMPDCRKPLPTAICTMKLRGLCRQISGVGLVRINWPSSYPRSVSGVQSRPSVWYSRTSTLTGTRFPSFIRSLLPVQPWDVAK